jgi:hypothetical protein
MVSRKVFGRYHGLYVDAVLSHGEVEENHEMCYDIQKLGLELTFFLSHTGL